MTPLIEELAKRFSAAQGAADRQLSPAEWMSIAVSVLRGLGASLVSIDSNLHGELVELVKAIKNARDEIASLHPDKNGSTQIAQAHDELDAIVAATEQATNQIMSAAETIEAVAGALPAEQGGKLTDAVTSIYEACSFQDITGQRVSKIVKALHIVEERAQRMIALVSSSSEVGLPTEEQIGDEEKALLNGPQLAGNGRTQDEIDALLNKAGG